MMSSVYKVKKDLSFLMAHPKLSAGMAITKEKLDNRS